MTHPLEDVEIDLAITLRGELAKSIVEIAARRKAEPVDLVADVIEAAFKDDIVDAIIDD